MSYIEKFKRNNPWLAGVSLGSHYGAWTVGHRVTLVAFSGGDSCIVDETGSTRSGYFNKKTCWSGTDCFKDFTRPTTQEKEMFHMLFGWEIPWSADCPLVL